MTATAKAVPRTRPSQRARTVPAASAAPPHPAVLRLTSVPAEPEAREALFYIDDVEYTIPSEPSASIALTAMKLSAEVRADLIEQGVAPGAATATAMGLAQDFTFREMIGEDGYTALCNCRTLRSADLRHIAEVCSTKAMGALEDPNR